MSTTRRHFLAQTGFALLSASAFAKAQRPKSSETQSPNATPEPSVAAATTIAPFKLRPLPYAPAALEPVISAKTLEFHHGKHHGGYVKTLNERVKGTSWATRSLTDVMLGTQDEPRLYNMAAQIWNHEFYWNSLSPKAPSKPLAQLSKAIVTTWGSLESFKTAFAQAATGIFGSGWAWLVADAKRKLSIVTTQDAGNPLTRGLTPLLTIDVWEHAYYLDVQNRRKDYVAAVVEKLLNWEFAEAQYVAAQQSGPSSKSL